MKTNIKSISLIICLFGCYLNISAQVKYFLDSKIGSDDNNGLTVGKPWRTLNRVKELRLRAGDCLLLHCGCVFNGVLEISGEGTDKNSVIIGSYGKGEKPKIIAPDHSMYAVLIKNSDYLSLQNIDITNHGGNRLAGRTGVKVSCVEYGISHNITLKNLNIHDVNGTLVKHSGEGSGILIENKWKNKASAFDGLLIENCIIRRCERNAMIWDSGWDRKKWFPSTHTVIKKNLIEDVPGDGIVPIGCDGVLVEYNLMRNCPDILPEKEAAAGMWPWSCDNAVFQYNEASDHKAPWDGQGFDSDFNCRNTVIQYNYSHDNDGGFLLICDPGPSEATDNIGNLNTLIQYNISINDGIRPHPTHAGIFSPIIHIAGPCKNTLINNNILHSNSKPYPKGDRNLITSDTWGGYSDSTTFVENIFYSKDSSAIQLTESTNNVFKKNYFLGDFQMKPIDNGGSRESSFYGSLLKKDPTGYKFLSSLMKKVRIADGEAYVTVVQPKLIKKFFIRMKEKK